MPIDISKAAAAASGGGAPAPKQDLSGLGFEAKAPSPKVQQAYYRHLYKLSKHMRVNNIPDDYGHFSNLILADWQYRLRLFNSLRKKGCGDPQGIPDTWGSFNRQLLYTPQEVLSGVAGAHPKQAPEARKAVNAYRRKQQDTMTGNAPSTAPKSKGAPAPKPAPKPRKNITLDDAVF